ncbi:Pre mRNA splicing regulator female lethal2D [Fasciola hepatica]|uniref:Pre mRNA splicing regulator female lethal2D n=1 Tax=Fasciola hepatica TaxID=6192 RepID=A0A4E0RDW2_FASHE|nr:Pre mRNA splicing regulator female lethal2D [Fasciola hepatica]
MRSVCILILLICVSEEQIQTESRSFGLLESAILSKVEAKEKELRYFLTPRSSGSEPDCPSTAQPVTTMAAIQSTVPAVRHVPTLISGLAKPADGLLGPAHIPHASQSTGTSSGSILNASSYTSTLVQLGSKSGSHLSGRPNDLWKNKSDSQSALEVDNSTAYSHVPVDAAVSLVLHRLWRAQNSCNALVTSNQTELQSFTFTQNSQNGKLIMMRVRVLEQENDELANVNRTGRAARLETEIALRRRFIQDLKQAHSDLAYLVEEAEAETEVFGSSLLLLQQRLNFAKASAQILAAELEQLDPGSSVRVFQEVGWSPFDETEDHLLEDQESDTSMHDIGDGPQIEVGSPAVSERSTSASTQSGDDHPGPSTLFDSPTRLKRSCSQTCSVSSGSGNLSPIRAKRRRSDRASAGQSSPTTPCTHPHVNSPPSIPVDGPQRTFSSNRGSLTSSDNEGSFERTHSSSPGHSWDQDDSNLSSTVAVFPSKLSSQPEGDGSPTPLPMPANGQVPFDST